MEVDDAWPLRHDLSCNILAEEGLVGPQTYQVLESASQTR
jgi:hypothetical protein